MTFFAAGPRMRGAVAVGILRQSLPQFLDKRQRCSTAGVADHTASIKPLGGESDC
jgi:hypothetical protein